MQQAAAIHWARLALIDQAHRDPRSVDDDTLRIWQYTDPNILGNVQSNHGGGGQSFTGLHGGGNLGSQQLPPHPPHPMYASLSQAWQQTPHNKPFAFGRQHMPISLIALANSFTSPSAMAGASSQLLNVGVSAQQGMFSAPPLMPPFGASSQTNLAGASAQQVADGASAHLGNVDQSNQRSPSDASSRPNV
jgi:hypothetical protein